MIPPPAILSGAVAVVSRVPAAYNPVHEHRLPDAVFDPAENVFDVLDTVSRVQHGERRSVGKGGYRRTEPTDGFLPSTEYFNRSSGHAHNAIQVDCLRFRGPDVSLHRISSSPSTPVYRFQK